MVFDLTNRSLDTLFNGNGIIDSIFSSWAPTASSKNFQLKGQPVLVDLNNDKKLEIAASAFYDDVANTDATTDWFTELYVYSQNGTKMFSKCEAPTVINSGCNDGYGASDRWEGTNPFIMDYNKNGLDDICFIKDVKKKDGAIVFSHMAILCYDYNGAILAETNISGIQDGVKALQ